MAYKRKTHDRWDIETNWGYGWEVECSEYTWKEAKEQYCRYFENCGGRCDIRIVKRRERIKEERKTMLQEAITNLLSADGDPELKEDAYRALERIGVDRQTADNMCLSFLMSTDEDSYH